MLLLLLLSQGTTSYQVPQDSIFSICLLVTPMSQNIHSNGSSSLALRALGNLPKFGTFTHFHLHLFDFSLRCLFKLSLMQSDQTLLVLHMTCLEFILSMAWMWRFRVAMLFLLTCLNCSKFSLFFHQHKVMLSLGKWLFRSEKKSLSKSI